ncbi:MAG: hypothetical protein MJZ20_03505 [Bacteroidaceae bacterium]|nr:hypothetical protein [Bacteroidaceae bacterium]
MKKIFSFLLVIASVCFATSFVSCSNDDYDDTEVKTAIANLEQALNQTKIDLQNEIDQLKQDLEKAHAESLAAAEVAQKAAETAQKAADNAQKSADNAQKSADDAQKSADDAQKTADQGVKAAAEALAAANAEEARAKAEEAKLAARLELAEKTLVSLQSQIDKLSKDLGDLTEKEKQDVVDLYAALSALDEKLTKAIDDEFNRAKEAEGKLDKAISEEVARALQAELELANRCESLEGRMKVAEETLKLQGEAIEKLQKDLAEQITKEQSDYDKLTKDLDDQVKKEAGDFAKINEELNKFKNEVKEQLEAIEDAIEQLRIDLNKEIQDRIAAINQEIQDRTDAINQEVQDRNAAIATAKAEAIAAAIAAVDAKYEDVVLALWEEVDYLYEFLGQSLVPAVNILRNDMDQLITNVIYNAQDEFLAYYNEVTVDEFVFPFEVEETSPLFGKLEPITGVKGNFLVQNKGGNLYATVNPNSVNFTNTTLNVVNSLNQKHPVFSLAPIKQSDKLLSRAAQENAGNGFYQMQLLAPTVNQVSPDVKDNGNRVVYALQAEYLKAGKKTYTTSQYAVKLIPTKKTPFAQSDFNFVAVPAGNNEYGIINNKPNDGDIVFTSKYEEEMVGRIQITGINANEVSKFYVQVQDAEEFEACPSQTTIYDGSEIEKIIDLHLLYNKANINKNYKVTVFILNYDGTIEQKSHLITFAQALLPQIEISKNVVPGASADNFIAGGNFARFDLYAELTAALQALNNGEKIKDAVALYKDKFLNAVVTKDNQIFTTVNINNANELNGIYDPMFILGGANDFSVLVKGANDIDVININVIINCIKPHHLDNIVTSKSKRIAPMFNYFEKAGDENLTIAWAKPEPSVEFTQNWNKIYYNLRGSFAFNNNGNLVEDAAQACTCADCSWILSNNSVYEFRTENTDLNIEQTWPYCVRTANTSLTIFENVNGGMSVVNAADYNQNNFRYDVAEGINYYGIANTAADTKLYHSAGVDNFQLAFYDPINYGIYMKSMTQTEAKVNFTDKTTPKYGIEVDWSDIFSFPDYAINKTATFGLYDNRIQSVKFELLKDKENHWAATDNWNIKWNPFNKTFKGTFDYISNAVAGEFDLDAQLIITDKFGVVNVYKFKIIINGPQGN